MGIQINGNTNNINAGIGSLSIEDINELDIVGVATAANFKTGVSNLHNLGLTLSGGQLDVGSNIKIGNAGVITATSFVGSGANLTGVLSNIVEDTSPQLGANLDTNTKCIDFGDSNTGTVNRLRFGASTDFEIFHNGTNNHIDCHTAGQDLYIRPTKDVYIQDYSTDDIFIKMIKDGAVELYHNDSKKFETASYGTSTTGDIYLTGNVLATNDNSKLLMGGANDLSMFHDGNRSAINNATGELRILSGSDIIIGKRSASDSSYSEQLAAFKVDGAAELYFNNSKKIETTNTGAVVTGICTATSFSGDGSSLTNLSAPLSFRNKIINGSMMVFQRGVGTNNYSGYHDGYYAGLADRWAIRAHSSMGTQTYSQNINSPNNFANSQRIYTTGADGGNAGKYYVYDTKLEGQDLQDFEKGTSTAKPFTLSFYVKCNINRVFTCELRDLDNGRICVQQYTTTNSNWNRYELTFPADTTGKFDDDKHASLWVRFWLSAGANFKSGTSQTTWGTVNDANICPGQTGDLGGRVGDYWYVTGIQLEVGDTATPFEQRSYADEFRRCARYCYQWIDDQQLGFGQVFSGSGYIKIFPPIPVNMRAKPSVTKNAPTGYWFVSYHGNSGYAGDRNVSVEGNSGDDNHQSANSFRIFVHGGSNQGNGTTVWCLIHDTAGAYLRLEAEL